MLSSFGSAKNLYLELETIEAQATKSPQEKNTRLENMSWRIWNLARQKRMEEQWIL